MSEILENNISKNNYPNQVSHESKSLNNHSSKIKKSQINFLKISILFTLIFLSIFTYVYWQDLARRKIIVSGESSRNNNLDNDIFDLADEFKNQDFTDDTGDFHVDPKDFRERNNEFIFRLLLKNQAQIELIKKQNQELKNEFVKYKNFEKFNKMSFVYIKLRDKFFKGEDYRHDLENFELSAIGDVFLKAKIDNIKNLDKNSFGKESLKNNFKKLIPEILAQNVVIKGGNNFIDSVNQKIAKIIVIRRTVINDSGDVDDKIINIENALSNEDYQEAMKIILTFDQQFNPIFTNFLEQLNANFEMQRIDQEIINYFNNIS